jgi:hypothetical protein
MWTRLNRNHSQQARSRRPHTSPRLVCAKECGGRDASRCARRQRSGPPPPPIEHAGIMPCSPARGGHNRHIGSQWQWPIATGPPPKALRVALSSALDAGPATCLASERHRDQSGNGQCHTRCSTRCHGDAELQPCERNKEPSREPRCELGRSTRRCRRGCRARIRGPRADLCGAGCVAAPGRRR